MKVIQPTHTPGALMSENTGKVLNAQAAKLDCGVEREHESSDIQQLASVGASLQVEGKRRR